MAIDWDNPTEEQKTKLLEMYEEFLTKDKTGNILVAIEILKEFSYISDTLNYKDIMEKVDITDKHLEEVIDTLERL